MPRRPSAKPASASPRLRTEGAPPPPFHSRGSISFWAGGAEWQPASVATINRSGSALSRGAFIADLRTGPARFEDLGEGRGGHGTCQVEALRRLAAARAQELELRAR